MTKRLSDTKAVQEMPLKKQPMGRPDSLSVDVRPIANGYVTTKSRYSESEGYRSQETYTPDKPDLDASPSPDKENALKSATSYLNKP